MFSCRTTLYNDRPNSVLPFLNMTLAGLMMLADNLSCLKYSTPRSFKIRPMCSKTL